MGFCIGKGVDCGNKVVWKERVDEKVDVMVMQGGVPTVAECNHFFGEAVVEAARPRHTTLTTSELERAGADGRLVHGAANICNHFFTTEFLEKVTDDVMVFRIAEKKIRYADAEGIARQPEAVNGIQLHCHIYDAFRLSKAIVVLEYDRDECFAPVKNAPGNPVDSPDTARALLCAEHKKWIAAAGAKIVDGPKLFEISPAFSYAGEGLEEYASVSVNLSESGKAIMRPTKATDVPDDLRQKYADAGQGQVFDFIDRGLLSQDDAAELVKDLQLLDLERVTKLHKSAQEERNAGADRYTHGHLADEPPTY
jgi:UDP-N-acetylglucosamine/UDP-N-acetylgalactosamine diphosphorylase